MRLGYVILVAVVAVLGLLRSASAQPDHTPLKTSSSLLDSKLNNGRRFLRTEEAKSEQRVNKEERRLVNLDLIIAEATKDAVHSVRMATKWKLQFAAWKFMNKKPFTLMEEYGIPQMGQAMRQHPKWNKAEAYRIYYGLGPLRYP